MIPKVNKAEELAEDHWKYVSSTLKNHGVEEEDISIAGFHYKTAFIHGFKHGVESKECPQK